MVMIKDNHISVAGGVSNALKSVDEYLWKNNLSVPVEVLQDFYIVLFLNINRACSISNLVMSIYSFIRLIIHYLLLKKLMVTENNFWGAYLGNFNIILSSFS